MMVDFHTHILPGVDDGAKTLEESIELLKEAKDAGFDKVILTPHYMEDYYKVEVSEREKIQNELNSIIKNIDIQLYKGNEIFITRNMIDLLKDNKVCTQNDSNYVLFELPFNIKPINIMDMVYEMQHRKLIPILAHPERYTYLHNEPEIYYELVEKGVLLQSNFGSFAGQYGKATKLMAEKLLECNLIHFLGSDVHRPKTIYKNVPTILDSLKKMVGEEKIYKLTEVNPQLVLENKKIEIDKYYKIKLSFREKFVIRKKINK
jgi:protein-tyrosine phosphatase